LFEPSDLGCIEATPANSPALEEVMRLGDWKFVPVLKPRQTKLSVMGFICVPLFLMPALVQAQNWEVQVGAQSHDKGRQVIAFLPNELWIHAGDSVAFTVASDEPHTVTFLTPGEVRPPFPVGCPPTPPGTTPSGSAEDGSSCVNSGTLLNGQGYSVTFPEAGNYKLVCLYHQNMTAMVHVLDPSAQLPHDQAFYSAEAADMKKDMLSSAGHLMDHEMGNSTDEVTAGAGSIVATGGGSDTLSVMRFMHPDKIIHVGDTVEWTNDDPITPHTITFGIEPANPMPPAGQITIDADGALHATISSPTDSVHSGFIGAAPQDQIGSPQPLPGVTRFRVTFTRPGIYPYKCALHDGLGMQGQVTVLP
jgi:plastocyanin